MKLTKILTIPDAHDNWLDKEKTRFTYAGRYIVDYKPDMVIGMGDFLTMDSLNAHDLPGTLSDKHKPSLMADIASGQRALDALLGPLRAHNEILAQNHKKRYKPALHMLLGNHDGDKGGYGKGRWDRYIQKHPELEGMTPISDLFVKNGFEVTAYGDYLVVGNTAFTHIPFNNSNSPIGGMNVCRKALAVVYSDVVVFGHVHTPESLTLSITRPDKTPFQRTAICVGSYCPPESYTEPGPQGWGYNLCELTLLDGKYVSHRFISYKELDMMYNAKVRVKTEPLPKQVP